ASTLLGGHGVLRRWQDLELVRRGWRDPSLEHGHRQTGVAEAALAAEGGRELVVVVEEGVLIRWQDPGRNRRGCGVSLRHGYGEGARPSPGRSRLGTAENLSRWQDPSRANTPQAGRGRNHSHPTVGRARAQERPGPDTQGCRLDLGRPRLFAGR